jgi:hypothetical protein
LLLLFGWLQDKLATLTTMAGVSLVTVDWVIQSLVTGQLQDVAGFAADGLLVERGLAKASKTVPSQVSPALLLRVKESVFESGESVYYKPCRHGGKPCKCGSVAVGRIVAFGTCSPASVTLQCWERVGQQHPPSCDEKCVWKLSNHHVDVALDTVIGKCAMLPLEEAVHSKLPCRWNLLFSV